ncbi:methyltransferase family protein [Flavobacterium ustbae]|uniref:methyltransferase family protein n=1 Tax=Flavobacterium ustbae TaxID=2488790 RepID=UPI000F7A9731|nr:isoprenylcysteine carboxylmethyltransferase family protein [Flavobacterium ustbae]
MKTSIPRIPPPFYFVVGLTAMILLNLFVPIGHWLVFPWRYTGIILIVLGFSLAIGSGMFFRKFGTDPRPGTRAAVIVTNGPFKYTRNPMYLGYITMLIGTSTLLGTLSPLIIIPIFFLILHTQFVLREEKWMEDWFGGPYLEYKKKTPRWLI